MTQTPNQKREDLVDIFLSIEPMRGHTRAHVEAALARVGFPDFRKATSWAERSDVRALYDRAVNSVINEELKTNPARTWDFHAVRYETLDEILNSRDPDPVKVKERIEKLDYRPTREITLTGYSGRREGEGPKNDAVFPPDLWGAEPPLNATFETADRMAYNLTPLGFRVFFELIRRFHGKGSDAAL